MKKINPNELNEKSLSCLYNDEKILTKEENYEMTIKKDKEQYGHLYDLPDIKERLIILDIEVTGNNKGDFNLFELSAFEMREGKITGKFFHSFFIPKDLPMAEKFIKRHKIPQSVKFLTPEDDKKKLKIFLDFLKDSTIISHNALYDMDIINKGLKNYEFDTIKETQFKCSERILLNLYPKKFYKFTSLQECLDQFEIEYDKENFHLAIFDSYYLAKIIENIYRKKLEEENTNLTNSQVKEVYFLLKEEEEKNNEFIGKKRKEKSIKY